MTLLFAIKTILSKFNLMSHPHNVIEISPVPCRFNMWLLISISPDPSSWLEGALYQVPVVGVFMTAYLSTDHLYTYVAWLLCLQVSSTYIRKFRILGEKRYRNQWRRGPGESPFQSIYQPWSYPKDSSAQPSAYPKREFLASRKFSGRQTVLKTVICAGRTQGSNVTTAPSPNVPRSCSHRNMFDRNVYSI